MKIVIDTNALVYAAKNKIDLFTLLQNYEIIIPNLVLGELQLISKAAKKASDKKAAFLALKLLERATFKYVQLAGPTDKAIADFAKNEKACVLTNDLALKKRLAKENVKILHIRQKKYIEEWT
ncbi:MAG: PIN domain-containing protein [Candidatus Nanoarchaeia archaeon]